MMEIDSYVSSHLATIKGNNLIIDDRFLLYFLITIDARDLMQDISYPSLKTSDISLIEIPLPPLSEQKRIVSILDKAFAAIDKAKANAEQNLKNTKELFESYLKRVFENKGEGWEEKRLAELIDNIMTGPFGSMLHKSDYVKDGIPVVNPQNIVDGQIVSLQKTMIN